MILKSKQKPKAMIKKRLTKGKIAIVVSRFNDFITKRLLEGCVGELKRQGVTPSQIQIVWVPGAFEIPLMALKLAEKKGVKSVICLGAVIRGETYHFELVAQGAALGIQQVALKIKKPIILGVITTETLKQAYARSQARGENKGKDAAIAALLMLEEISKLRK